jgi:hypothetical protein
MRLLGPVHLLDRRWLVYDADPKALNDVTPHMGTG